MVVEVVCGKDKYKNHISRKAAKTQRISQTKDTKITKKISLAKARKCKKI